MVHCVDGVGGRNPQAVGAPEIATGGADGSVKLWDTRQERPVLELTCTDSSVTRIQVDSDKTIESKPEAWCTALGGASARDRGYLAAGFDSGDLKLVDLRMMRVCLQHHFPNGLVSLEFDR